MVVALYSLALREKMKNFVKMLIIVGFASISQTATAGKVEKIANKNVENWNYALKSGHVDAVMRFYGHNAMLVESNGNIYGDVSKIRAFWKELMAVPGAYEFNLTEAHRDGDSIVMTAELASTNTKNRIKGHHLKTVSNGTIQQVLKDEGNGRWKTIVQQFN